MSDDYDGAEFLTLTRLYWGAPSRRLPGVCWVCEVLLPSAAMVARFGSPTAERARCVHVSGGIVDAHHLVPRRVIKGVAQGDRVRLPGLEGNGRGQVAYGLGTVLMDPRNAILVRRFHHDALEHGTLAIPKVLWPEEALAFARELDLEYWIDNKEAKRA
jgi:hypothetical protein